MERLCFSHPCLILALEPIPAILGTALNWTSFPVLPPKLKKQLQNSSLEIEGKQAFPAILVHIGLGYS